VSYAVKDSGQRARYDSGMVRDVTAGKVDWHRVTDGPMLERWAAHLTKAEAKYPDVAPGIPNWTLAEGDEERARFRASAFRHFMQWFVGETDEDHAAAVFFNINGSEYVRERAAPTATVTPTATICLQDHPISETCTPDLAVPVGPQGWTVKDELKMRP
jgi:hypothetical protein